MAKCSPIQQFEIGERFGELLGSQRAFIFSPARFSAIAGGFGSGKTRAGVVKGLVLSAVMPGNVGMVARYHASDLEDTTIPVFFEVCPPSWIRSYNKKNNIVVLRNNSVILFRHIHDATSTKKNSTAAMGPKTRRLGANLGWFFIDQMEELDIEHWNAMISRLRLPRAKKKFGFGALNPNGHDWIWKKFFPTFRPWKRDERGKATEFFQVVNPLNDVVGVAVNSEENRETNGGFVEDKYFDSLIASYGQEWADRYIYCSFDDFTGKIYKEYASGLVQATGDDAKIPGAKASDLYYEVEEFSTVHNIDPIPIPKHWELVVGIDVGGDSPWAVIPEYVDDEGNTIVVPGFHKATVTIAEIAGWIKSNLPWNESRTRFVIDWENKVAMLELAEHGIHCTPARKEVRPGILRVGGYFHVQPGRKLPPWYEETQARARYLRFKDKGSPRTFVFKTETKFRTEHDTYVWNPNRPNEPLKTNSQRWDTCDAHRYVIMMRPEASKLGGIDDPYVSLQKFDPMAAREWTQLDKRIEERKLKGKGGAALREADMDEMPEGAQFVKFADDDWEFSGRQEW